MVGTAKKHRCLWLWALIVLGVLGYRLGLSSLGDYSIVRQTGVGSENYSTQPVASEGSYNAATAASASAAAADAATAAEQNFSRGDYQYYDFKSDEYKTAVGDVLDGQRDTLYKHLPDYHFKKLRCLVVNNSDVQCRTHNYVKICI